MDYLQTVSTAIGMMGVVVIVFGLIGGLLRFVRTEWLAARGRNVDAARMNLRQMLGYYLLLGLEFLIAADIIETLRKPGPQELIVLGTIVIIRTVISYSLNAELRAEHRVKVE